MPVAPTRWVRRLAEFCPKADVDSVPRGTRGIYVLFNRRRNGSFDVVYVGLSGSGMRGRLRSHRRSSAKAKEWTHFSLFQVYDNVSDAEIAEVEGLFRQIYRNDSKANRLNIQKMHGPLRRVRINELSA